MSDYFVTEEQLAAASKKINDTISDEARRRIVLGFLEDAATARHLRDWWYVDDATPATVLAALRDAV